MLSVYECLHYVPQTKHQANKAVTFLSQLVGDSFSLPATVDRKGHFILGLRKKGATEIYIGRDAKLDHSLVLGVYTAKL